MVANELRDLAAAWRKTAHLVAADMKGKAIGPAHFKPTGTVKAKMATQVSVLLTCAASLEALL